MSYKLSILLLCATGSALCMDDDGFPRFTNEQVNELMKLSRSERLEKLAILHEQHKAQKPQPAPSSPEKKVPKSDASKK